MVQGFHFGCKLEFVLEVQYVTFLDRSCKKLHTELFVVIICS